MTLWSHGCARPAQLSTYPRRSARASEYSIPLRVAEAEDSRDALAASIYSGLFGWVVEQICRVLVVAVLDQYAGFLAGCVGGTFQRDRPFGDVV